MSELISGELKIQEFLVAQGNKTVLGWGCDWRAESAIINRKLGKDGVEQVGFVFVDPVTSIPRLKMMGGELCINATLALASVTKGVRELYTSGLNAPVSFENRLGKSSIKLAIPYRMVNDLVLFDGIGFQCVPDSSPHPDKPYFANLAGRYNLPAFGIIKSRGNRIFPTVYVKKTDSLVSETACGSGSIAFSLLSGTKEVIQPSQGVIKVEQKGSTFTITAKVDSIREN